MISKFYPAQFWAGVFAGLICTTPLQAHEGHQHHHESVAVSAETLPIASASRQFPNPELIDQDGRKVRFFDDLIRGKVVMINFFFTTCESYCALDTARLKRVQQMLGDRVGKDIFFYSISVDPKTDTPEVLRKYRERFGIGAGWTFLTGNESEITAMRAKLGLLAVGIDQTKNDHSLSVLVGNEATGQWMRRSNMDKAEVMAKILGENLAEWRGSVGEHRSYSEAPVRIEGKTNGELLFKSRCLDCHSIGRGDGLGPDLIGVTKKRTSAWLRRWIVEPDKVIAEKDPDVTGMVAQFKGLLMPNLSLTEREVDEIIDYIEKASVAFGASSEGALRKSH